MATKVQKWDNSQGLQLSKTLLGEAQMKVGNAAQVSVQGQKIIIEPLKQVRGRYNLKDLVSQMPKDYQAEEVDWKTPMGKEEW
jgi:antitoxin MazE